MENGKMTITEQIKKALDGRSQRWLSLEVRMPEQDLSKKIKGIIPFKDEEIKRIEDRLAFKLIREDGVLRNERQNKKKLAV